MIKELFLATIISTSVSVRTPNDEDKPLDYEFSVKAEKNEGKFTFYEKVDYERELGENYIDITGKYNYKFDNDLFIGLDYVNKEWPTPNSSSYWFKQNIDDSPILDSDNNILIFKTTLFF